MRQDRRQSDGLESLEPRVLLDADPTALFVVGNTALNSGDSEIQQRLLDLSFIVTAVDDDNSGALSGSGYDLVVISSTVSSGKVGDAFRDTTAAVMTWETYLYDNLGMTGDRAGTDYGYSSSAGDDLTIASPGHALSAGLSGTQDVSDQSRMGWGRANGNATVGAWLPGSTSRSSIFAYDTGASMFGIDAPGRRVGLFMDDSAASGFTPAGGALFDAAAEWAIGRVTTPPPPTGDALVILPLGDSITRSRFQYLSYRYYLWQQLVDDGINFDFVGTENTNGGDTPSWPDHLGQSFDRDHEGHGGFRVDQINSALPGYLSNYTPDIALVHLGTNDIIQDQSAESTINDLRTTVARLRADNPDITILLSKILPIDRAQGPEGDAFNAMLPALVAELSTAQSEIILVDNNTGFDVDDHLFDSLHPNHAGEQLMAERFYDALDAFLGGNNPPSANAGPDQVRIDTDGNGSETFALSASGSGDSDGTIASYTWSVNGSVVASGAQASLALGVGTHTVTLTVVDNDGAIDTDTVRLTVESSGVTPPQALLVVGSTSLNSGDRAIRDRLESLGFGVEVVDDSASRASDADGKDLVFISATVSSGAVSSKFRDVSAAVVAAESYVFDDLGLTGGSAGTDYGFTEGETSVTITDAGHALAGGLSAGEVSVASSTDNIRWGRPVGDDAVVIAYVPGSSSRATVFGFDQGASLASGTAAGRRVGMFLHDDAAASWTSAGQSLFDAAVLWAIDENTPPPPTNNPPQVDAGPDRTMVTTNGRLTLAGQVSDDGQPNGALTATWSVVSAPGAVSFDNPNDPATAATLSGDGVFVLRLTGTDGELTTTNDVTITVNPVVQPQALLVVGSTSLNSGDRAIRDRLESLGFGVEVVDDSASRASDADGKDLVFISATVSSGAVSSRFRDVSAAVVAAESYVFDDLGLTGGSAGTDFGFTAGETSVTITDAGHALAGGLSAGEVSVASSTDNIRWGRPVGDDAVVIAYVPGSSSRATVFGFDQGASLASGTAAGRRVGMFLHDDAAASWTSAGQSLFDAAVLWAIA